MANAKTGEFVRKFDKVVGLKNDQLFNDCLVNDIKDGVVFPAVRSGRMDFYHKGGKLFSYTDRFVTHYKYASIMSGNFKGAEYIDENRLGQSKLVTSFVDAYSQMKELCSLYANGEAAAVSNLFSKFSAAGLSQKDSNVVVLDVEVSLRREDLNGDSVDGVDSRKQDRIDLLLMNKNEKTLRFYEVKLLSNNQLRSNKSQPHIEKQIEGYNAQLEKRHDDLLMQYGNHIRIINELFGCNLPEMENLDDKTRLIIFGFDNDQKKGRLKDTQDALGINNSHIYAIGNSNGIDLQTVWNKTK